MSRSAWISAVPRGRRPSSVCVSWCTYATSPASSAVMQPGAAAPNASVMTVAHNNDLFIAASPSEPSDLAERGSGNGQDVLRRVAAVGAGQIEVALVHVRLPGIDPGEREHRRVHVGRGQTARERIAGGVGE